MSGVISIPPIMMAELLVSNPSVQIMTDEIKSKKYKTEKWDWSWIFPTKVCESTYCRSFLSEPPSTLLLAGSLSFLARLFLALSCPGFLGAKLGFIFGKMVKLKYFY